MQASIEPGKPHISSRTGKLVLAFALAWTASAIAGVGSCSWQEEPSRDRRSGMSHVPSNLDSRILPCLPPSTAAEQGENRSAFWSHPFDQNIPAPKSRQSHRSKNWCDRPAGPRPADVRARTVRLRNVLARPTRLPQSPSRPRSRSKVKAVVVRDEHVPA
jgi:hypothetical protein